MHFSHNLLAFFENFGGEMRSVLLLLGVFQSLFGTDHFLTYIIPCYNCEAWVEQSVESMCAQTIQCPFEIICTDDGSTDGTYDLLKTLAEKHPEVRVFKHEKNRGGAAARNTCVQSGVGDIIFCLDADNVLAPDSIQILIDVMDEKGVDIVCFGRAQYFVDDFQETGAEEYYADNEEYTITHLIERAGNPAWSGNYLYTRKSYDRAGGYSEKWGALDTFSFGFTQVREGARMIYVPGTLYWHRHGIASYFVRKREEINRMMFQILMENCDLLTTSSFQKIYTEYSKAMRGDPYLDYIALMDEGQVNCRR